MTTDVVSKAGSRFVRAFRRQDLGVNLRFVVRPSPIEATFG